MSRSLLIPIAVLVGIGLAAGGIWRWQTGRGQLRAESELFQRARLEAARWNQSALAAQKQRDGLRARFAQSLSKPKAVPGYSLTLSERLKAEPALQRTYEADLRAKAANRYGALFHQLGLSPEQVAKFEANLIHREEQEMELQATVNAEGLSNYDPASIEILRQIHQDYQAAQQQLLGDEAYAGFQTYERTADIRSMVNGWAGAAVVVAGSPLSPTQAEALVRAVANASPSYQAGGLVSRQDIDWNQVDLQAATFLSPAQLEVIQKIEPDANAGRFHGLWNGAVSRATKAEAGSPK